MDNKYKVRNENIRRVKNNFKDKFNQGDKVTTGNIFYKDYVIVVDFGAYNFIGQEPDTGAKLIFDYDKDWFLYEEEK